MTSGKEIRELLACSACQVTLIRFPDDGQHRNFALTCAPETREFNGCDNCLKIVVDFILSHSQEGRKA